MTPIDRLAGQTLKAFDAAGPADRKTGAELTKQEYVQLASGYRSLTPADRARYSIEVAATYAVSDAAMQHLIDAATHAPPLTYAQYVDGIDPAAHEKLLAASALSEDAGRVLTAAVNAGSPAERFGLLERGIDEAKEATTMLDALARPTQERRFDPNLTKQAVRTDRVRSALAMELSTSSAGDWYSIGRAFGEGSGKSTHVDLPSARHLGPNSFSVAGAQVTMVPLSQFDRAPRTNKPLPITPPLSETSLLSPPNSTQNLQHSDAQKTLNEVFSFVASADQLNATAEALARSAAGHSPAQILAKGFLNLPVDICTFLFGWVALLFDPKERFADLFDSWSFFHSAPATNSTPQPPLTERVRHLSPAQATRLAQDLVTNAMEYDFDAIAQDKNGQPTAKAQEIGKVMDALGVQDFLKGRKGVCRNYASAVQFVFQCLKTIQDPKDNQLTNCYMRTIESDGKTSAHAWNALCMIEPNGQIVATQIDATWADVKGPPPSPDIFAFGSTAPTAPEGLRYFWFQKEFCERIVGDGQWFGDFARDALGAKSRDDARTLFAADRSALQTQPLSDAQLQRLSDGVTALPTSLRNSAIEKLKLAMSAASFASFEKIRNDAKLPMTFAPPPPA